MTHSVLFWFLIAVPAAALVWILSTKPKSKGKRIQRPLLTNLKKSNDQPVINTLSGKLLA
jgi:hypothetical protein